MSTSRKEDHVRIVVNEQTEFKHKRNGFDAIELQYNALPELDFTDLVAAREFLGFTLRAPLVVTGMTGGYPDAERINGELAAACAEFGVAFGLGSMRPALQINDVSSFTVVKPYSRQIPIIANIGAVQAVEVFRRGDVETTVSYLADLVGASAIAIHLNPLQELMQPEGEPRFRGVLDAIEAFVGQSPIPIIVKEVGAGISGEVARRLVSRGVSYIDVAGAGGTSWAGVEILRRDDQEQSEHFWDVGIPTADSLRQCRDSGATLIASGGIRHGTDVAKAVALGAHVVGAARPILLALEHGTRDSVVNLLKQWELDLHRWMFLTGSQTLHDLDRALPTND